MMPRGTGEEGSLHNISINWCMKISLRRQDTKKKGIKKNEKYLASRFVLSRFFTKV